MTANGKASGTGYVQAIIDGINSKRGELQTAMDALTSATAQYQQTKSGALDLAQTLAGAGNLDEAAKVLSNAYGMSIDQAKENLTPLVPKKMADGGLVKGGQGGILAMIGEGLHNELVLPLQAAIPMLTEALQGALGKIGGISLAPGALSGALGNVNVSVRPFSPDDFAGTVDRLSRPAFTPDTLSQAVYDGLSNLTLHGEMEVNVDGVVQKHMVKFFSGFRQAVRGA